MALDLHYARVLGSFHVVGARVLSCSEEHEVDTFIYSEIRCATCFDRFVDSAAAQISRGRPKSPIVLPCVRVYHNGFFTEFEPHGIMPVCIGASISTISYTLS